MRFVLAVLLVTGCVTDGDEELDVVDQEGVSLNGVSLNGVSLNGVSLSGVSLDGVSLTGVSPIGSTLTGTTSTGTVSLRIDRAQQGSGTNSDLWFYGVSYQTSKGWAPICNGDLVLPVPGVWSATAAYTTSAQVTFACRGTTVAKCVELGYKPQAGYANQLASCTRLLRGDYCGTGVPYTADGTTLNLYDNVGVQRDTQAWLTEAEWGPSGARCVTNLVTTRFLERRLTLPPCLLKMVSLTCGSFRSGTYLIDELPLLQ